MRAVVLFSGGQDSTTCLYLAIQKHGADQVAAVSVDYLQRHRSELTSAERIAVLAGVKHSTLLMPALAQIADSALVAPGELTATGGRLDAEAPSGLPTSFVPNRNLILLALAAAVAVKLGAVEVWTGVCQADYSGYPDCRQVFIEDLQHTINLGLPSSVRVELIAPLMDASKADAVRKMRDLGGSAWAALGLTTTCYHGKRPGCGECPSCVVRARGFADAGYVDPAATPIT